MATRFNKNNVLVHIERRMEILQQKWGFNSNNGWAQVANANIEKIVAYGEFNGLDELHTELCNSNLRS